MLCSSATGGRYVRRGTGSAGSACSEERALLHWCPGTKIWRNHNFLSPLPPLRRFPLPLTPSPEEKGNVCVCFFVTPSSSGGRGRGMEVILEGRAGGGGDAPEVRLLLLVFVLSER